MSLVSAYTIKGVMQPTQSCPSLSRPPAGPARTVAGGPYILTVASLTPRIYSLTASGTFSHPYIQVDLNCLVPTHCQGMSLTSSTLRVDLGDKLVRNLVGPEGISSDPAILMNFGSLELRRLRHSANLICHAGGQIHARSMQKWRASPVYVCHTGDVSGIRGQVLTLRQHPAP